MNLKTSRVCWLMVSMAILAGVVSSGCRSYRTGNLVHPQLSTIAIGEVRNETDEPALAVVLRKKLAEQVMRDGSLRLVDAEIADIIVVATIPKYETARSAAAKLRSESDLPDERSTYRTSFYEVKVDVEYSVLVPLQNNRVLMPRRKTVGEARFPQMPDLDVSRQSGLQQALHDAATQIITSITEAW
jgi:hypothetical protein